MSKSLRPMFALCVVLVVSIVLGACQSVPQPNPAQSPVPTAAPEATVIKVPPDTAAAPATQPQAGSVVTGTIPTPSAGYAIVVGTILDKSTGLPPSEAVMFLGQLVGMEENFPLITVDRQTAPKAIPSPDTGRFVFMDVPPGEYGLSFWTPDGSFLVDDPQKPGISLILKLESGSVVDIGTLQVPPH
jgi:hypothetical protein